MTSSSGCDRIGVLHQKTKDDGAVLSTTIRGFMNQVQQTIFNDRYARRGSDGQPIETDIEQMWFRVAAAIGTNDTDKADYYRILNGFRFVPGGRIMSGAGAEGEKTPYNCYVIPVETEGRRANRSRDGYQSQRTDAGADSREAIFDTIKTMVDIMSRGGGVGINWSVLRPSGAYLTRISGTSSGPVGWMDVASTAVGEVEQGGSRRGAAMFMLDDWHPDVLRFIEAKTQKGKITNANISVAISDEFMEAVKADLDWELRFPDTTHPAYDREWTGDLAGWISRGYPVKVYATVPATDIWQRLADSAHASGEPGVVFLGRYNELSTGGSVERIICVNPCGEQGLGAYSVCNLGAMNLAAYVEPQPAIPGRQEAHAIFDFYTFAEDVKVAIRFLDDVIDRNSNFLPEAEIQQQKLRRIGLSVMGLADALVMLGIRYGSEESVTFVEDVFRTMKDASIRESISMALEKGPAKAWDDSMWERPYLKSWREEVGKVGPISNYGLRNIFLLTQAPTGTTSLLAGVNSGIEPYFNIKPWREDRTGGRFIDNMALAAVVGEDGSRPSHVVTSQEVTVEEHIAIQSAVQRYVDSSVSKTINAPKDQTKEETLKAFTLAYESGLKGIAYYRDGSRDVQVLYHESPNETIAKLEAKVKELSAKLAFKGMTGGIMTESTVTALSDMTTQGQDLCPDCLTEPIVYEEGCKKCHNCGWSAC